MFQRLGNFVVRFWPLILVGWVALLVVLSLTAPNFKSVVQDGEFAFLPEDEPSRVAEEVFRAAFPTEMQASQVVIVLRRESNPDGLEEDDFTFITETLVPRIRQIAEEEGGLAAEDVDAIESEQEDDEPVEVDEPAFAEDDIGMTENSELDEPEPDSAETSESSIISRIRAFNDKEIGDLLLSEDQKATLVYVELTTEFLEYGNQPTIRKIEELVGKDGELRKEGIVPPGLAISISGSATVGRDMSRAAAQSAKSTELWTILLVLFLLVLIYRAPLLAIIPLSCVGFAAKISLSLLALGAQAGLVSLFDGIEVYVTVLVYGAGVDYCLFLIARYKEELDSGATYNEGIANSLGKVGAALTASAGTVMCGIGMMVFADFGKFREAGVAITFSLFICLCAALTLTPSLLRLSNRWAFWPKVRTERISRGAGWITATSPISRLLERNLLEEIWTATGRALLKRPTTIWLLSIALMLPFAVIGVTFYSYLSYGLLAELPQDEASVVGAKAVQAHFPAGYVDPVKVLLINDEIDFSRTSGVSEIAALTNNLREASDRLGIADVRSVSHPQGGEDGLDEMPLIRRRVAQKRSVEHYVSDAGDLAGHATRMDIVFQDDPFSRNSIEQFSNFEHHFRALLPESLQESGTRLHFIGATPSIYDLKRVTDRDQIRIDVLVLGGVFLILVVLLRRPAISAYLIVSVFFSYLATLGVTFAVFWSLDPAGFSGLDWKVPMFLFTILIAVGEDYNIFLMTRIEEEQQEHGPVRGIVVALERTGSIISSCGIIMAGTFSSLLAGELVGMHQLGFALAFGVLLDTFVVRPILVPAYLILLYRGRFGRVGRWLGAPADVETPVADLETVPSEQDESARIAP